MKTRNEVLLAGTLNSDVILISDTAITFKLQTINEYTKNNVIEKEKEIHTIIYLGIMAKVYFKILQKKSKILLLGRIKYRKHLNSKGEPTETVEIRSTDIFLKGEKEQNLYSELVTTLLLRDTSVLEPNQNKLTFLNFEDNGTL